MNAQQSLPDPDYHIGRPAFTRRLERGSVPDFTLHADPPLLDKAWVEVECSRCWGRFAVPLEWLRNVGETRPCPNCFKVSVVPSQSKEEGVSP